MELAYIAALSSRVLVDTCFDVACVKKWFGHRNIVRLHHGFGLCKVVYGSLLTSSMTSNLLRTVLYITGVRPSRPTG